MRLIVTPGLSRSKIAACLLEYRRLAQEDPEEYGYLMETANLMRAELRERRRVALLIGSPNKPGVGCA